MQEPIQYLYSEVVEGIGIMRVPIKDLEEFYSVFPKVKLYSNVEDITV